MSAIPRPVYPVHFVNAEDEIPGLMVPPTHSRDHGGRLDARLEHAANAHQVSAADLLSVEVLGAGQLYRLVCYARQTGTHSLLFALSAPFPDGIRGKAPP
jgi:hypothetical protein